MSIKYHLYANCSLTLFVIYTHKKRILFWHRWLHRLCEMFVRFLRKPLRLMLCKCLRTYLDLRTGANNSLSRNALWNLIITEFPCIFRHFDITDKADDKEAAKIFSVPDFVGDACKAIASRVRGAVAGVKFDDFHKVIIFWQCESRRKSGIGGNVPYINCGTLIYITLTFSEFS